MHYVATLAVLTFIARQFADISCYTRKNALQFAMQQYCAEMLLLSLDLNSLKKGKLWSSLQMNRGAFLK